MYDPPLAPAVDSEPRLVLLEGEADGDESLLVTAHAFDRHHHNACNLEKRLGLCIRGGGRALEPEDGVANLLLCSASARTGSEL